MVRLRGYGATADASHITAPPEDGEGAARAMRIALERARLKPEDVQYINAHGTSTPLNDRAETQAIKATFGKHAGTIAGEFYEVHDRPFTRRRRRRGIGLLLESNCGTT